MIKFILTFNVPKFRTTRFDSRRCYCGFKKRILDLEMSETAKIKILKTAVTYSSETWPMTGYYNNIYLLQLGCYPVAVLILHVNKT